MAGNYLESGMNELDPQLLLTMAARWPWRWFRIFREAAQLCERERCRFNVLKEEHHLLRLEANELHKLRTSDAEKYQGLWAEFQGLKVESAALRKEQMESAIREKQSFMELAALREERKVLIEKKDQAVEGVTTLFEFIRRSKSIDDRGKEIPSLQGILPTYFRK